MVRRGNLNMWAKLVLVVLLWGKTAQAVPASVFDFNEGTVQGWTLQGAFDPEIYNITFPSNFTNGWNDYFNYPELPGSDPAGNMQGSLQMYTSGGHGIDNPGGEWWLMRFHSPDLSISESWQRASGYSVSIAECMGGGFITLYANLFVNVYDLDLDRERFFANGVAVPLAYNTWSYHSHNWLDSTNFPTNYVIREVFVDIWGLMADGSHLNGGVYLDEVIPVMPIYVDDDGGGPEEDGSWEHPFDSIQKGINAALNGEIVLVRDGTYTGEGNRDVDFLGRAITVRSENGPNTCIINCEGTIEEYHRGFNFHSEENANSVLEGFTIINGLAQDGGGICCDINSSPSIRNCVIRDCNAHLGAGVYFKNSSPTITNCMISNNDANSGGGIYSNSSDPTITNCTFNGNQASNYGGAICCYNSNPVITNCTIQGNSAIDPIDSYGGGIYCNNSSATVKNCIFWANTAGLSGAEIALVDTLNPSELTISYSDVEGGFATAYIEAGCTLNWDVSNIDMDPCLMLDNYHLQSCSPCIDSGDPLGDYTNQTDIDGYSRISNARVDIGADEFSPPIYNVTQDTYHDTIQQAIDGAVNGDTISIPDGIYTGPGNRDVHFNGKAITVRSENGPANCVVNCDGREGEGDHRGFCFNHNEEANSVLDGITITNGYCMIGGGIWCHYSSPTIINCIIRGNTANDDGGGILCSHSSPKISNCTLIGNTAWRSGGAIACREGSQATINNCTASFNISRFGGGIYCNNSSPSIRNCLLWHNIASGDGAEIALKSRYYPSMLTVSYSDVAGGSEAAYVESGCTLNWGQGNIDMDPLLTPDGHLLSYSLCIDAGDPNLVVDPNTPTDIDGDDRIINGRVDMGSDEFIDTDGDRLPDWWEGKYFDDPNIADHNADPDGDGLSNLREYELYSSDPNTLPYYVDTTVGNDNYDGLASTPQGGDVGPKKTIQAGIDAADDGDTVIVAAGTYTGPGNRWLDFGSQLIVLRSSNGPASTTIDCEKVYTRAFNFHLGETPAAAVVGFTITNGLRNYGGAIVCLYSHPQIRNCVITDNSAYVLGSGLYSYISIPTLADCNITNNSPDAVWMQYGGARIDGMVSIVSNNWVGNNIRLTGGGTLQLSTGSILSIAGSQVDCNMTGLGTIEVPAGEELTIANDAVVDLGDPCDPKIMGIIDCKGRLRVKDNAKLYRADIRVAMASFEGNALIGYNRIRTFESTPYGQMVVKDAAVIVNNDFHANGDRYIDVNPLTFADANNIRDNIRDNHIYVTITKAVGSAENGIFELRGEDYFCGEPPCDPGNVEVEAVPAFDLSTWTIDRLELQADAQLTLANRFGFQADYDGDAEVLYVRELILGPNSILDIGANRLYYESLDADSTADIISTPLLGLSLDVIDFDDDDEFANRVGENNFEHAEDPFYDRVHVEKVSVEADPNGVMLIRNLEDIDPESPTYGDVVYCRAKTLFAKCSEDAIIVQFKYLFGTDDPDVKLHVYVSDVPELLDHDDPNRAEHYIEAGYLSPPPSGRPGMVDSNQFGVFEEAVSVGSLDLTGGTWIELELIEPDQSVKSVFLLNSHVLSEPPDSSHASAMIGGLAVEETHCGICMDLNHSNVADEVDFAIALAACGVSSGVSTGGIGSTTCIERFFSSDGFIDLFDAASIDWLLEDPGKRMNACNDPDDLSLVESMATTSGFVGLNGPVSELPLASLPSTVGDLLIIGKTGISGQLVPDPRDRLYTFDRFGENFQYYEPASERCNFRLLGNHRPGGELELYQINSSRGVSKLDDGSQELVVAPGQTGYDEEPRYHKSATVYIGVQSVDPSLVGRPVLDAAFDSNGYTYVVPVEVAPDGEKPYWAAAKLKILPSGNPRYQVEMLYDNALSLIDEQYRNNPREIEVDGAGNVYVLNVHYLKSDILWKYDPNGTLLSNLPLYDSDSDSFVPDPIAMHISDSTETLYLATAQNNQADVGSTPVYGFSAKDLTLRRSIMVSNMQNVTGITEDPTTGTLWVVGFNAEMVSSLYPWEQEIMVEAVLAKISLGSNTTQAVKTSDFLGSDDLELPMSIVWTGPVDLGRVDMDGNDKVDLLDFALLAEWWENSGCIHPTWCGGADLNHPLSGPGRVDVSDLLILARNWLKTSAP